MEKPKNISITDHNKPKKTPTNFVRSTVGKSPDKKTKASESASKKQSGFVKRQDESWEY